MQEKLNICIAGMLDPHLSAVLFSMFVLPFLIYYFFGFFCFVGLVTPLPEYLLPKPEKPIRVAQPTPEQDSDCLDAWNDKPDDSWFDPEPQTDSKLIEDVISGLQQIGFKKRDAKLAVLKVCEGRVFEDHQSLVEAALNKSNL